MTFFSSVSFSRQGTANSNGLVDEIKASAGSNWMLCTSCESTSPITANGIRKSRQLNQNPRVKTRLIKGSAPPLIYVVALATARCDTMEDQAYIKIRTR